MKAHKLAAFAIGVLLLASCNKEKVETDEQNERQIHHTNSPISTEGPEFEDPEPTIKLANGSELFFMEVEGADAMFVVEGQECEDCSALDYIRSIKGQEVTDFEIFWAYSSPSTTMPEQLVQKKSSVQLDEQQGWAIEGLANRAPQPTSKSGNVACNNSSFQSGSWYGGSPNFVRLDAKQITHPGIFLSDCYTTAATGSGACWGNPRYKYKAQYNNLKKWKGRICCKNVENSYNSHWIYYSQGGGPTQSLYRGPQLKFSHYYNGSWHTLQKNGHYGLYSVPANSTKSYTWHWISSSNQNFKIEVRYAKPYDEFDILMDK